MSSQTMILVRPLVWSLRRNSVGMSIANKSERLGRWPETKRNRVARFPRAVPWAGRMVAPSELALEFPWPGRMVVASELALGSFVHSIRKTNWHNPLLHSALLDNCMTIATMDRHRGRSVILNLTDDGWQSFDLDDSVADVALASPATWIAHHGSASRLARTVPMVGSWFSLAFGVGRISRGKSK